MEFYRMQFNSPLDEADGFEYRWDEKRRCAACGQDRVPIRDHFHVPEDDVKAVELRSREHITDQLFIGAHMLVATRAFANAMHESGITGFELRDASIMLQKEDESQGRMTDFAWILVTGRCDTNDVWTKVVSACPDCGAVKRSRFPRATRAIWLLPPRPPEDLSRPAEAAVGIIVSERFKEFVLARWPSATDGIAFQPLQIRSETE
jgi:hypothetical protein